MFCMEEDHIILMALVYVILSNSWTAQRNRGYSMKESVVELELYRRLVTFNRNMKSYSQLKYKLDP